MPSPGSGTSNAVAPDKPFFVFYATGTAHAPHHAPKDWIAKFQGPFRPGLGPGPRRDLPAAEAAGRHPRRRRAHAAARRRFPPGTRSRRNEKKLYAHMAEVYAAALAHADYHVGRVIDAIDRLGKLDNTLVIYIQGDNGASAEGTLQGTAERGIGLQRRSARTSRTWCAVRTSWAARRPSTTIPSAGPTPSIRPTSGPSRSPRTLAARATGWSFPGRSGSRPAGEVRTQFHHVIDIAPTILEVAGVAEPKFVNGVAAEADRRREPGLYLRRRQGPRPPQDAILRDARQPGHLPRRLGRRNDAAAAAVAAVSASSSPRRTSIPGNCITSPRIGPRRKTWRTSIRRN